MPDSSAFRLPFAPKLFPMPSSGIDELKRSLDYIVMPGELLFDGAIAQDLEVAEGHADSRLCGNQRGLFFQIGGQPDIVGIAKGDPVRPGEAYAQIALGLHRPFGDAFGQYPAGIAGQHILGVVGRTAIDDDDLAGWKCLCQDGIQSLGDQLATIVGRHYHRERNRHLDSLIPLDLRYTAPAEVPANAPG